MSRETAQSLRLGIILAAVGGFLDAYTYVGKGGVFANAQTGNIVLLALSVGQRQWAHAVNYLIPVCAFVAGVGGAELLHLPRITRIVRYPAQAAIGLEAVVLAVVGLLPPAAPNQVATVAIAAMSGFQVTSFRKVHGWIYNTTMSTGNLRSAAQAVVHAVVDRDANAKAKALNLAAITASFAGGAGAGGLLTVRVHDRAIWVAAGALVLSQLLFVVDSRARQPGGSPTPRT